MVFVHWRLEGRALLDEVRDQLFQCTRVHHRAGENMGADGSAFFDDCDLDLAEWFAVALAIRVVLFHEAREVQRTAEVRRAGADEHYVKVESHTIHKLGSISKCM